MKGRKTRGILFFFCIILATLSGSWIFISILDGMKLFFTEFVYQFVFIMSCLSFFISVVSTHQILASVKEKIEDVKNKEKNVKDMYRYNQLLDPPDADMNN